MALLLKMEFRLCFCAQSLINQFLAVFCIGMITAISANVQAQSPTQQVEVKAKSEVENARRDASAKTIITNAELLRFGDNTITDAMKRVPGVIVSQGVIKLPGMGSQYTQILVDGEALRAAKLDQIPMAMIERVEIYRLGSAEFSSAAIAGTINIILKKIPREAQQQIKVKLSDAYAPATSLEWRGADKRDNLSYALTVGAGIDKNIIGAPRLSSVTVRDVQNQVMQAYDSSNHSTVNSKTLSFNPEAQYKMANGLSIRSNSAFAFSRDHVATDVRYSFLKGAPLSIAYLQNRFFDSFQSANTNLKIGAQAWQDVRLDFSLGLAGTYSKIHGKELNFKQNMSLDFERGINRIERSGGYTSTLKLSTPIENGHDVVVGWNGNSRVNNDQRLSMESKVNVNGMVLSTLDDQTTHSVVSRWAFFIQDDWRFKKSSSASMGLRLETVSVEAKGNQLISVQNSANVWSPIVQTLWQLNPENTDRLRLGVARTYRPPSNFQLVTPRFEGINNSLENPNFLPNPKLNPELAWSIDAAFEHNDSDQWNYNIRSVIRKIEDVHREDVNKIAGVWWRQFVNDGQAISKQISIDTQFPLKRFIPSAPALNFNFSVSKNWTSLSNLPKPDNRLTPISFTANANIDYNAKDIPLSLGASLRYRDGHPVLVNAKQRELNQAQMDVDIYGLWKFDKKMQLRMSIDNLLKRSYAKGFKYDEAELNTTRIDTRIPYRLFRLNFEYGF